MNPKKKILVCDDDLQIAGLINTILEQEGYSVELCATGEACVETYNDTFDLVLLDLQLPDATGMDILKRLQNLNPRVRVIIFTGHSTVEKAVEAMRLGAFNFIPKPFEVTTLLLIVKDAAGAKVLGEGPLRSAEGLLVSRSAAMTKLLDTAKRVAIKDVSVILLGESGVGKEVLARYIHELSPRRAGPFIAVNCPAIPGNLLESELFGHEKGAFTGASARHVGKFQQAEGGTLFLDEIVDLSHDAQAKILRVIQERVVEPIGAKRGERLDIRVIAASNRSVRDEAQSGRFRQDLVYRLAEVELQIPPLRDRKEDIPDLIKLFCHVYARQNDERIKQFLPDAVAKLCAYEWPGNIRELQSIVRRSLILANGETIGAEAILDEYLPRATMAPKKGPSEMGVVVDSFTLAKPFAVTEKKLIEQALLETNGNLSAAAIKLQIGRANLYRKIKKYGLEVPGMNRSRSA